MKRSPLYLAGCLFSVGWGTLLIIAILALLKHFVFDILPIRGDSMFPNFHNSDIVVLNKISYVTGTPQRGDSVVLRFPGDPEHQRYIKRLIGLPGEKIKIRDGKIYVNDQIMYESYIDPSISTYPATEVTLGPADYYLLGDNRDNSSDSRIWGTASKSDFIGKAFFIIFPIKDFGAISQPTY